MRGHFVHIRKSIISKVTTKKEKYMPSNDGEKKILIVFCPQIILFYRLVETNCLYSRHMYGTFSWRALIIASLPISTLNVSHVIPNGRRYKWQCAHISGLETNWSRPKNVAWRQILYEIMISQILLATKKLNWISS